MRRIIREPNGPGLFEPGMDLVAAGSAGKAGVLAALKKRGKELEARFSPAYLQKIRCEASEKIGLTPEILAELGAGEWEYVEEGGVFAALWNLSGAYGQGISFELLRIPVSQGVVEVCELFDLNPYRLSSGECVLIVSERGRDLAEELRRRGILAAWIGKVEKGIARKVLGAGGTGFLERPQPDEIEKV